MTVTMATEPAKLETLFNAARTRPADARGSYLDRACAGDPELRGAVESLLHAFEQAGEFLETQPALTSVVSDPDSPAPQQHPQQQPSSTQPLLEGAGTVIGRYKLL